LARLFTHRRKLYRKALATQVMIYSSSRQFRLKQNAATGRDRGSRQKIVDENEMA
jgi:hypothetical protein